jgi:hypothetical protein
MLSRLLHFRGDKRLEQAAQKIAELEALRPRMAEIEASLEARAAAERVLLRRLTDCRVKLELTGHRLRDLTAQAADDERAIQRERDRADSAERRLAEMTSGRAKLHAKFEQEHALLAIAEKAVQRQELREAEMEERLRTSTEALELAVSTLSEKLAARRASYEQLVPSLTDLAERLHPLLERAVAPPQPVAPSPPREDEHLRFYITEKGYEMSVVQGPPPQTNTVVDRVEHGSAMVVKLGRSPLPADDRRCAYLLPYTDSSEEQPRARLRLA